jgi:glycosyltransferase involved in cell wall biosynthesis
MVSPSFYPMIGGVESYVRGIGMELVRLGHEVTVYTPDSVLGRRLSSPAESIDGVRIRRIHVSIDISYRLRLWPDLLAVLAGDGPDIVHVYSHDSYALPALMAARACGAPFIVTTYGPFEGHSEYGMVQGSALRLYDMLVSPVVFRHSNRVMIRYPAIASWLGRMNIPAEKIRLEPSGIPADSLVPRDGSGFREKQGVTGPMILYLGRISPQKGVQHAVEAMRYVLEERPDATLVLIGPDYVGFTTALRASAVKSGIERNLKIIPSMSDEESQLEAIAACDVFLMPSTFEGFSQAVLKAMAQGKPVVVTSAGGLPYEIDYGGCGSACPYGDSQSIGKAIMTLLNDRVLASRMGGAGRRRAERFTFDVLAKSLSSTYSEIAG